MTQIQERSLLMFKELNDILEKANIPFVALGGTAIGAFREKGFISWDDDIDLGIFEEDIDRFKEAINASKFKLSDQYRSLSINVQLRVFDESTKVRVHGTLASLFIDIFVIYKTRRVTKLRRFNYEFWKMILRGKRTYAEIYKRHKKEKFGLGVVFGYWIFKSLTFFFGTKKWLMKKSLFMPLKWDKLNDNTWSLYHIRFGDLITSNKIITLPFENVMMPVFESFPADNFKLYGDIMISPKNVSQQVNHEIELEQ